MPFTADEITRAGWTALNFHIRNTPIDQISVERPLLRKLMSGKRSFPGGKQYIVENLRKSYDSNFGWYYGDQQVSYNKRDTVRHGSFPWRGCHDGFALNEDELFQNGITVADGPPRRNTEFERDRLTDLLEENTSVLRLGFEEKLSLELHQDGTQHAEALAGLDHLIPLDPSTGVVGGIDRATNAWWKSFAVGSLSSSTIIGAMETKWRETSRNGGRVDCIVAGSTFVDTFRTAAKTEISRYTILSTQGQAPRLDPSIGPGESGAVDTGLHFHGVPIMWSPEFADLDALLSPATPFEKRCYFLNSRFIRLRPAKGHDMIPRQPPRVYDRYTYYWGMTWKGGFTLSRSNAHAVLSVS